MRPEAFVPHHIFRLMSSAALLENLSRPVPVLSRTLPQALKVNNNSTPSPAASLRFPYLQSPLLHELTQMINSLSALAV